MNMELWYDAVQNKDRRGVEDLLRLKMATYKWASMWSVQVRESSEEESTREGTSISKIYSVELGDKNNNQWRCMQPDISTYISIKQKL